MLLAAHVGLERVPVTPPRHHHQLASVTIRLPHLEVDEPVEPVDEPAPAPEREHELLRTLALNAQPGHGHVHNPLCASARALVNVLGTRSATVDQHPWDFK